MYLGMPTISIVTERSFRVICIVKTGTNLHRRERENICTS